MNLNKKKYLKTEFVIYFKEKFSLNKSINKNFEKINLEFKKFFLALVFLIEIFALIYNFVNKENNNKELEEEILNAEKYYKICQNGILLNKIITYKKNENPKISIISTIYNKENYILRFLRSIQNQMFDNIEIILVDDFSEDNSIKRIEIYKKEDERIILLKNKKNKGTLISRNLGIFLSKGKYIIIPDIDDILLKDLFILCFNLAEKNDFDMIRYQTLKNKRKIYMKKFMNHFIGKTIYQPKLSFFMFYGSNHLEIIDPMITNKFIKRNIFISSLNSINKNYLNQNMIFYEDTLINFILCKNSKSLYFIKKLGYFYLSTPNSSTKIHSKADIYINKTLKSIFLFLKFILENTKNIKYEKNMANNVLKKETNSILSLNMMKKINNDFIFFRNILDLYINNKFINILIKRKLSFFKDLTNYYKKL